MSTFPQRPPGFVFKPADDRGRTGVSPVRDRQAALFCDSIPLSDLASRFGTPLYIYSETSIRERVAAFRSALSGIEHEICYSVKANSNLTILRLLAKLRCGFDVVSGGELERVLRASLKAARKIVFSGVGKTIPEIEAALKANILLFNVESAPELDALIASAGKLKRHARIAIRVNPDVPAETHPYISTGLHKHKFGVPIGEAREIYRRAASSKFLSVSGVSVHIGSQITDVAPFSIAMDRVAQLVAALRVDGHKIEYVDAGGGLGINYRTESDENFSAAASKYARAISEPLRKLKLKLLIEPGRSVIGPAGVLLTRVLYRKTNGEKKFVIVDAAMNDLIRPSLYQAEHEIVPVIASGEPIETVDIVGPVCESGDFFARGREVPRVQQGDLLAILDTGAYGMALASNYNSRPRPSEVLVNGKAVKLIRRRETINDLIECEL